MPLLCIGERQGSIFVNRLPTLGNSKLSRVYEARLFRTVLFYGGINEQPILINRSPTPNGYLI